MADIRRTNDQQNEQRRFNRVYQYQQLGPNAGRIPFLAPQNNNSSPRDENYWDMLKFTFCPRVRLLSLTSFILLVNTVVFIACIGDGIVKEESLLQIPNEGLIKWGAMVPLEIKTKGAFWLLFTSLFVTFNFLQYLTNILFIIMLCSSIEQAIGALSTSFIYVGGGMLGALFGALVHCCTDQPYVETQSAIYAMLGSATGFIILNWDALARLQDVRCFLLCILLMLTFLVLLITISSSVESQAVDKAGIIGGLAGGFFLTLATASPVIIGGTYEKKCRLFGFTFAGIQLFITLLMLILVIQV